MGAVLGGGLGLLIKDGLDANAKSYIGGDAGFRFAIEDNTFQYKKTTDIRIRGTPVGRGAWGSYIANNVFTRSDEDAAISLDNADYILVSGSNQYNVETYGTYRVCDIDGDGVDDLFLATGVTWWFSSKGQFPWSYLNADRTPAQQLVVGDFDGDGRCDVLRDVGAGVWEISRGGVGKWEPFGSFDAALWDVRFGRFDPASRDQRHGVRSPTHVFRRSDDGEWFVTPLGQPRSWQQVGNSSFPLSDLRFGDFTGDGVTDVLGIEEGHWAISESARSQWRTLNPGISDAVSSANIFIVNMDARDNIDDVLRLDEKFDLWVEPANHSVQLTWVRSQNGSSAWSQFKSYGPWEYPRNNPDFVTPGSAFVGYFGPKPFGTILTIDQDRLGHFFSPDQPSGAVEWLSQFYY